MDQDMAVGLFADENAVEKHLTKQYNKSAKSKERSRSNNGVAQSLSDLRLAFNQNLARVYNNATQDKGISECHKIMKENSEDRGVVRLVIGALTDKQVIKGHEKNANAMGFHASMFGFLGK